MKNKYIIGIALVAIMVLSVVAFLPGAMAEQKEDSGNGAPSGKHYTLNILGMNKTKQFTEATWPDSHDNGHRLFVMLNRDGTKVTTDIRLICGDSFKVIDPDGTDRKATLQLKDPWVTDTNTGDQTYAYDIYVRALGKPGGKANITLKLFNGSDWYYGDTVEVIRGKNGVSKFDKRTLELTTIEDPMLGGTHHLFDDPLYLYYWQYDNFGLKHLQMRFYLNESVTPADPCK